MSNPIEGRTRGRMLIALAVILLLVVAAFSVYYFQSQTTIASLQARGTFSQSLTLLPRTNLTVAACSPNGCDTKNTWQWRFPYNLSLKYPGYLNVTVYNSNNTVGIVFASWSYSNSKVSGNQNWDYSKGAYPRTTPSWMIVPVIKEMIDLNIAIQPASTLASWQTMSIRYYY